MESWVLVGVLAVALSGAACGEGDMQESLLCGSGIQRTMSLLHASTPDQRSPVNMLIYGQSITGQGYVEKALDPELRKLYPNADIRIQNRSIGGYSAPTLVRTAVHDLYPPYPDLVIFHVYDGAYTGELERIIGNIRRYTTSEIMLLTHHVTGPNRDMNDDEASKPIRALASKYGCELVDIRAGFKAYLAANNLKPEDLLGDVVHLNARGGALYGQLVLAHFRFNPLVPDPWANIVRTYEARRPLEEAVDEIRFDGKPWRVENGGTVGESSDGTLVLKFTGNRVDVISHNVDKPGSARVLIDGRPPSSFPTTWASTRPTPLEQCWFPAVNRVTLGGVPRAEDWTLTVTFRKDDGTAFDFALTGSVTGPDGKGESGKDFVSNSGRIRVSAGDFSFTSIAAVSKKPLPKQVEIKWSVYQMATDVLKPNLSAERGAVNRTVLAQMLPPGQHELRIIPNGDGPVPVKEIIVHRPPMMPDSGSIR